MKAKLTSRRPLGLTSAVVVVLVVLLIGSVACDDEQRLPRADFRSPTGLAYIERPLNAGCTEAPVLTPEVYDQLTEDDRRAIGALRSDELESRPSGFVQAMLLVADSEAEGVRVQQYQRRYLVASVDGQIVESFDSNAEIVEIVPGPAVFFPLVLSTRGFPTKVASSVDRMVLNETCEYPAQFEVPGSSRTVELAPNTATVETLLTREGLRGARSFALSVEGGDGAGSAAIHVIDTAPRPVDARSRDFEGFLVARYDLAGFPETAGPRSTVDLATVAFAGCEPPVVTDPFEVAGCDNDGVDIVALAQAPFGTGDGRLVFATIPRDGGGPTFNVVTLPAPARPTGLAVIEDRIVVSNSAGRDVFEVPFTVTGTVVVPQPARRIDVWGPTRLAVDAGPMGIFVARIDTPRLIQLVRGPDGRLERGSERLSSPFEYEADPDNPGRVGQLDLRNNPVLAARLGRADQLVGTVGDEGNFDALRSERETVEDEPVLLLAFADGDINFVIGAPPRLATLRDAVETVRRLDGGPDDVRITDCEGPVVLGADGSEVADPDGPVPACLPVEVESFDCSGVLIRTLNQLATYRATYRGSVLTESAGTVRQTMNDAFGEVLDLELTDDSALDPVEVDDQFVLRAVSTCTGQVETTTGVVSGGSNGEILFDVATPLSSCPRHEIQWLEVAAGGEEAVLALMDGPRVERVLDRVSSSTTSEGRLTFSFIDEDEGTEAPLDLSFTVELAPSFTLQNEGRICFEDADCFEGFVCEADDPAVPDDIPDLERMCFSRCQAVEMNATDQHWARTGVEVVLNADGPPVRVQLRDDITGTNAQNRLSLPADVVFSPLRRSWLISVPGNRALAEVAPVEDGIATGASR